MGACGWDRIGATVEGVEEGERGVVWASLGRLVEGRGSDGMTGVGRRGEVGGRADGGGSECDSCGAYEGCGGCDDEEGTVEVVLVEGVDVEVRLVDTGADGWDVGVAEVVGIVVGCACGCVDEDDDDDDGDDDEDNVLLLVFVSSVVETSTSTSVSTGDSLLGVTTSRFTCVVSLGICCACIGFLSSMTTLTSTSSSSMLSVFPFEEEMEVVDDGGICSGGAVAAETLDGVAVDGVSMGTLVSCESLSIVTLSSKFLAITSSLGLVSSLPVGFSEGSVDLMFVITTLSSSSTDTDTSSSSLSSLTSAFGEVTEDDSVVWWLDGSETSLFSALGVSGTSSKSSL